MPILYFEIHLQLNASILEPLSSIYSLNAEVFSYSEISLGKGQSFIPSAKVSL
jgi:hypothetical protein